MIKKVLKKIFSFCGITVTRNVKMIKTVETVIEINPFIGFDYALEGFEAVNLTKDYSMLPHINLFSLFEQAIYCEKKKIEGCFVECGVWKGGAVGIMAKANLDYGNERRVLHLFDVFDGICPPNAKIDGKKAIEDTQRITGFTDESKMLGQLESIDGAYEKLGGHGTIDICKSLLEEKLKYPSEFIQYHKGWFEETIPNDKNQIDKIAILRLDGDWYNSIKICLDNLYDKVVSGGLVIIDDYGYYEGCTKAVDEFLEKRNIKSFLSYSRPGCRYFVKP